MVVFPVKKQFYLIVSPNFNSETAESFGKVELNLASTPSLECLRRQYSGKVEPDLECLRRRLLEGPTGFPPDPNPAVFLEKTTSPVHYSQGQNRQSFSGGRLHWNVLTINVDHLESVEVSGQRQRFIFQT